MSKEFIKKYSLFIYFTLCFVIMTISVIFQLLALYFNNGYLFWFSFYPGIYSPTISAIFLTGIMSGSTGIKALLKGFTTWKVNYKWYLAALIFTVGPLIAAVIYFLFGGMGPGINPSLTPFSIITTILFLFFTGPMGEEAGWRGFALPRLEKKYNAVVSSIILGILWTFWHLPLYFIPGSSQSGIPFPIYMLLVVSIAILMTWAYNNTGGSLLITVLFHFFYNLGSVLCVSMLGFMSIIIYGISGGTMILIFLILVIRYFGMKNLSRKPDEEMPYYE